MYIKGTITLEDGTTSEFSIGDDAGWNQWGATTQRIGRTVDLVEGMAQAAADWHDEQEDDDDEDSEYAGSDTP